PEASASHCHRSPAILASLLGSLRVCFLTGFVVDLGNVFSRLALRVIRASEKFAVPAELLRHRRAAVLTLLVSYDLLPLYVRHVPLCVFEILGELLVKLRQRIRPSHLTLFDLVQLLFHVRSVLHVEQIVEASDEQIVYDQAEFGRKEPAFLALY